jgi:hypothetical protein
MPHQSPIRPTTPAQQAIGSPPLMGAAGRRPPRAPGSSRRRGNPYEYDYPERRRKSLSGSEIGPGTSGSTYRTYAPLSGSEIGPTPGSTYLPGGGVGEVGPLGTGGGGYPLGLPPLTGWPRGQQRSDWETLRDSNVPEATRGMARERLATGWPYLGRRAGAEFGVGEVGPLGTGGYNPEAGTQRQAAYGRRFPGINELGPTDTGAPEGGHPNAMLERLAALDEAGELYHPAPEYLNPSQWRGDPGIRDSTQEFLDRLHRVSSGRPRFPADVMRPYHQWKARNLLPETIADKARSQWSLSLPAAIQRGGWGGLTDPFLNADWGAAIPSWLWDENWRRPAPDQPKSAPFGGPRAPGEGLFNPISPSL